MTDDRDRKMTDDTEAEMKLYRVTVRRTIAQTCDIEIEAENEDEARELAEAELLNISDDDWDNEEATGDPEIVGVTELVDEPPEEDAAA